MMDERQLRQTLHTLAQQEVSDDMNLWPKIHDELITPRHVRPALRLGRLAAVLALLLMVAAAAYAVDRLLQTGDPGLDALQQANLITELGLTQTQGAVTVTLEYAYADANRISIVYSGTAQVPLTDQIGMSDARLFDDQGRAFRPMFGGGGGGGGAAEATPETSEVSFSGTVSYDASVIEGAPERLALRLELDMLHYAGQPAPAGAAPQPGTMTGMMTGPDGQPVLLVYTPAGEPLTFTFTFDVPFNPGRVLNTPQTAAAGGLALTLQKLVVAPSMTQAVICAEPSRAADLKGWLLEATITVNGAEVLPPASINRVGDEADPACGLYMLSQGPLPDSSPDAAWVLVIPRLRQPGSEDQASVNAELERQGVQLVPQPDGSFGLMPPEGMPYDEFWRLVDRVTAQYQASLEGPWTFTFTLP